MHLSKTNYKSLSHVFVFIFVLVGLYVVAPSIGFGNTALACSCPGYAGFQDTTCGGSNACPVGQVCTIACYSDTNGNACSGCTPQNPPPPPNQPPPPGGWGSCGSCNCGIGNSPGECRTCPSGCCWDPGGCAVTCNPTNPAAPILSSPANNAVLTIGNGVRFVWSPVSSWGNECGGTTRYYKLYYRERVNAICSGTLNSTGNLSVTALNRTNILPNKEYCWYVTATNGAGRTAYSATRYFTTIAEPTITNYSVTTPNTCVGSLISGRTDSPKANNPIKITVRFQDVTSDFANNINNFTDLHVIIIPQSEQNSTDVVPSVIEPQAVPRLGFQATNLNGGSVKFASLDNGTDPKYGADTTTGNLTNAAGTATLMNLNNASGSTVKKVSNNEIEVTWQIRFENTYPTAPLNVYVSGVATVNGVPTSQDADSIGGNFVRYTKAGTWQTDMMAPTAQIGNPAITGPSTFNVSWTGNDTSTGNTGVTAFNSYCYVTGGTTMDLTDTSLSTLIHLPTSPLTYPTASNCLMTNANQGTHGYSLNSLGSSGDVVFGLHVEDGACNPAEDTQQLNILKAWLITVGGLSSATGGYSGFSIPNVTTLQDIVPNIGGDDAYLGTYSVIAGNNLIVGSRQSKNNYYVKSYSNLGKDPPAISGNTNWFDYLYKLASNTTAVQSTSQTTMGGSISSALGIAPGSEAYFVVNGSLTLNSGTLCNAKVGLFITGNLTINPDITRFPGNGCVFIVKGDITVGAGTRKTASGLPAGSFASYDQINAFLVTNGKFSTSADTFGGSEIPDALYIRGGVVAKTVSLKRDLGASQNAGQPAEVFDYDPYYADSFRNIFASNSFSIRSF